MSSFDPILDCAYINRTINAADSSDQSRLNVIIDTPPIGIPTPTVCSQIDGYYTSDRKEYKYNPLNQKPGLTLEKIIQKAPKYLDPRKINFETKIDDKTKEETQVMTVLWKDGGETVVEGKEGATLDPCFGFLTALGKNALTPEKILFKPPATIVFWKDGSKTVVKCMEGEPFNEYFGFLAALGKKIFGTNSELNRIVKRGQFSKEFKVPEKPSIVQESYEVIRKCITDAIKSPEKKKPASNSKTNKKGAKK